MLQEAERIKWQAERDEADRKFRAEQTAHTERFQAEQAELADKRHRETLETASKREAEKQTGDWKRTIATLAVGGLITLIGLLLREALQKPPTIIVNPGPPPTAADQDSR